MAAEEVADVRDRRAQRTGVTYGNMRAKLSDYIGQVFECKAARGKRREANGERHVKRKIVDGVFFLPPAPCPLPLTSCPPRPEPQRHHELCGQRHACAIVSPDLTSARIP